MRTHPHPPPLSLRCTRTLPIPAGTGGLGCGYGYGHPVPFSDPQSPHCHARASNVAWKTFTNSKPTTNPKQLITSCGYRTLRAALTQTNSKNRCHKFWNIIGIFFDYNINYFSKFPKSNKFLLLTRILLRA
jgi:hypothetical protein